MQANFRNTHSTTYCYSTKIRLFAAVYSVILLENHSEVLQNSFGQRSASTLATASSIALSSFFDKGSIRGLLSSFFSLGLFVRNRIGNMLQTFCYFRGPGLEIFIFTDLKIGESKRSRILRSLFWSCPNLAVLLSLFLSLMSRDCNNVQRESLMSFCAIAIGGRANAQRAMRKDRLCAQCSTHRPQFGRDLNCHRTHPSVSDDLACMTSTKTMCNAFGK